MTLDYYSEIFLVSPPCSSDQFMYLCG